MVLLLRIFSRWSQKSLGESQIMNLIRPDRPTYLQLAAAYTAIRTHLQPCHLVFIPVFLSIFPFFFFLIFPFFSLFPFGFPFFAPVFTGYLLLVVSAHRLQIEAFTVLALQHVTVLGQTAVTHFGAIFDPDEQPDIKVHGQTHQRLYVPLVSVRHLAYHVQHNAQSKLNRDEKWRGCYFVTILAGKRDRTIFVETYVGVAGT